MGCGTSDDPKMNAACADVQSLDEILYHEDDLRSFRCCSVSGLHSCVNAVRRRQRAIPAAAAMSPLARSLLALTALFVAVDANVWDPYGHEQGCAGFNMAVLGAIEPQQEVKFDITVPTSENIHDIPNRCSKIGGIVQFQSVEVCNAYKGLTSSARKVPKVTYLREDTLSPIYASCEGAAECGPLVIHVNQACNPTPLIAHM
ncbi:uncharacterized protein LOC134648297 [Cydia amplana]|uniref:uncharacterized protein LOC134648297 n=1 Tax=Cydia amplana TaxID=1869771 RepID=UPI002FE526EE